MTIQLATSLILLFGSIYGPATTTESSISPDLINDEKGKQEISLANSPITIEDYLEEEFKDSPILKEIAKCESTYRHFGKDGSVIRGKVNAYDVGLMQINETYHLEKSKKLGFDIYTLEGNIAYAKWLYEKEGVQPWKSSSKCWEKMHTELSYAGKSKI
jgi:hypothetical protein